MSNFLEFLRQRNIFGGPPVIGNDLPQQGGITGRMPYDPNSAAMGMQFPGVEATPPPVNIPGTMGVGQEMPTPPPGIDPMFSVGPFEPQQYDFREDIGPTPSQGMDAGQRMRELYTPSDEASRKFEEMIDQYPQEKRPGWLRGIGSLLQEYAYGPKVAQQTRDSWRSEPIEDWKNKIAPMQQAATNERYQNVNERTMAYQQMATELRERAQIAKEKNDERKAMIQQQRADIYAYKARNPGKKFFMPKGGNVQVFDPATGETTDTGIPTGSMTDLDRLELTQEQALERIGETGAQARETEQTRQTGRIEAIEARGEQARQTRQTVPGGVAGSGQSPTQIKVDQYNKARQIVNSSPALGKYIRLGSGNEFTVIKPNERGGPTPQMYSTIINSIYGAATQGGPGRSSMSGPGPGQPMVNAPKAPAGWKYVPKPGGGWTAVPDK